MPLQRRLPKRGFTNLFKKEYAIVNLKDLGRFEANATLDRDALKEAGLVKKGKDGVKILGHGDISVPLVVKVNRITKPAREKIEAAGGSVELVGGESRNGAKQVS
jgi:large subunit ribosomal protein L15